MKSLQLLLIYLFTVASRKKKALLLFFLGLVGLMVIIFFSQDFLFKDRVSEGLIGTYQEQDLPESVTGLISKSLITIDKTGAPKGNLAEKWESNKEATNFKVKLKDNLYWTDGTKVKTSEIALSIPDTEISTPDDLTLEFKLKDSFAPFLTLLDKPILKKDSLVGVGPYKIADLKKDTLFIKRLSLTSEEKALPEILIRFYPNEKIAKNALKLGEIQALVGVTDLSDVDLKINKLNSKTNYYQLVTIFYNTKDPILSDENFRLALSFASPLIKDEIEAKTSIPETSWAFNPNVRDYLENVSQAKVYLSKVQKGKDEPITLTVTSSLKNVGEKVVEAWNKNGIKAKLQVESGIPQNFQALLITQNIPKDPDQYSLWHSTQASTNISKIASPRIDKDLEDGRKIADLEIRKQKYQDFQKTLLDESPATFLYFPKLNIVYLKKAENSLNKVLEIQYPN